MDFQASTADLANLLELKEDHKMIGLSTGAFADLRGDWQACFNRAVEYSREIVELSALSQTELGSLADFLVSFRDLVQVKRLTIHAPAKDLSGSEHRRAAMIGSVARMGVKAVIVHPDVVKDIYIYAEHLGGKLVVENMDSRKSQGKTAKELVIPARARFCLDVAHVKTVTHDMSEAHKLLDRFGDRLIEVHVSSVDENGHHGPLTKADLELYMPVLDCCRHVPWVLEG